MSRPHCSQSRGAERTPHRLLRHTRTKHTHKSGKWHLTEDQGQRQGTVSLDIPLAQTVRHNITNMSQSLAWFIIPCCALMMEE